jgi:DNA-binding beta-propeller fold protein YncE
MGSKDEMEQRKFEAPPESGRISGSSSITAFLALTDNDEGPRLWQRWTSGNAAGTAGNPNQLLKQISTIDVPGPKGKRFDYLTIDYERHLLFSMHLGAGLLYAIDLQTSKVVKTFADLPGIEGVEITPDVKKAYTSNWHEDKIGVIDLEQMKWIKKATESKPDGTAYAAPFHKIYVFRRTRACRSSSGREQR